MSVESEEMIENIKEHDKLKELQEENNKLKQTILNMTETMFVRDVTLTKTIREIEKALKAIAKNK